ncbi:MAG: methionine adenosyltransferase domain-containing protein [Pseudomonadota bacterium]
MRTFVLTSESMTAGHPDKLCDQISDAIVDACLASDGEGGIVAECAVASGIVFLSLRHRRPLLFDAASLARRVIRDAGYREDADGGRTTVMIDAVHDPLLPGPEEEARVASHMTTTFGYACDHTPERMPYPVWAAHRLSARLDTARKNGDGNKNGEIDWAAPDAQVQVAVRFADRRPVAIAAIALTIAGGAETAPADLETLVRRDLISPAFADAAIAPDENTRLIVRSLPGRAGPRAHAGLTGRKTADDCYGAFNRHPSSALSGKDPGRMERLAAYGARQAALSVIAAGLARECEVQLSYAPGDSAPLSVGADTFGTGTVPDNEISARLVDRLDFTVSAMSDRLDLWPLPAARDGRFFRDLATYGHFGRSDLALPWEQTPGKLALLS